MRLIPAFSTQTPLLLLLRPGYSYRSLTSASHCNSPTFPLVMTIDSHVHIWDPRYPHSPSHPLPDIPATAENLLSNMRIASVSHTLLVQPINYRFNHTYLFHAISRYPSQFSAIALSDTSLPPNQAASQLSTLVTRHKFRGVRINPTFTSRGLQSNSVSAVIATAGQLNVPVALFTSPEHIKHLEPLLQNFPRTKLVLDHFAFCTPGNDDETFQTILRLGQQYPQLYVKASAWFRVSNQPWPHQDLHAHVADLISSFGANRILIGSDYPFVTEKYSYEKAFTQLDQVPLSSEERAWISGGTAAMLYNLH